MSASVSSKVVVVTGASSGIGRAAVLAFADAGASVVAAARREDALQSLASERPGRIVPLRADVASDADVASLMAAAIARFGRIDILVNNAGLGLNAGFAEARPEDERRVMEVNFFGVLRCVRAALPHMLGREAPHDGSPRGQIVNVGSVLGAFATPRNAVYSASKHAVRALSDALRMELAPHGVEVIHVMPGFTDTDFFASEIRYETPGRARRVRGQSPARVARAIVSACARRRREVVLSATGKAAVCLRRFAPRLLDRLLTLRAQE